MIQMSLNLVELSQIMNSGRKQTPLVFRLLPFPVMSEFVKLEEEH
jgi:hypothetical protein